MRNHVGAFVEAALKALLPEPRPGLRVLEVGSYAVDGQSVRPLVEAALPGCEYVGVDMREGPGVDVVVDFENGEEVSRLELADVVICVDTLEHCQFPDLVVDNMNEVLVTGGLAIVAVPFTFQIHEHPNDYWRFTQEGLRALFRGPHWDLITFQDPVNSVWPHTVCALARSGRKFTDAERVTIVEGLGLTGCCAKWRTNEESVIPKGGQPMVVVGFDTPTQASWFLDVTRALVQPETLEERYRRLCDTPSDINEHLPMLRELAASADGLVVEFGTRGAVSTTALLAGAIDGAMQIVDGRPGLRPYGRMLAVDVDPVAVGLALATLGPLAGPVDFEVKRASSLDSYALPGHCALLFIDTLHTYTQLRDELELHHDRVRGLTGGTIVLHDTETFGLTGEDGGPGLMQAINEFQAAHPEWVAVKHFKNNNGLTILERNGQA